jgi:hypothetical protein
MKPFFSGIKSIISSGDFIFGTYFKNEEYLDGPRSIEFIREDCSHVLYSDIKSYKLKKVEQNYSNFSNLKEKHLKEFSNTLNSKGIFIEDCSFVNKMIINLPPIVKLNQELIENYIENFCTYHSSIIDCIIFDFESLFFEYNSENNEFEYKNGVLLFEDYTSVVYEIIKAYRNFFPDIKIFIQLPNIFNIANSFLNSNVFEYIVNFYKEQLKNVLGSISGFSIKSKLKDIDTVTSITTLTEIINICNNNQTKLLLQNLQFEDFNTTGGKLARQNLAKSKYTSFFNNLIDAGINFNNFSGIILTNLAPIYSPEVNRFPNGDYSANSVFDENYLLTPFYRALRTFFRTLITIPE